MSTATKPISINQLQTKQHSNHNIPIYTGAFWTARQRQMHSIHYSISYRASFKPELPDYFIRRLLNPETKKAVVLDPFGGRGTTTLQANLLGHKALHNDRNPVSSFLIRARQNLPTFKVLENRLKDLQLDKNNDQFRNEKDDKRLLPFFHPQTLNEITQLREFILQDPEMKDHALQYIGLVALTRLHGHSGGFFSVYSFPQISILPANQLKNNIRRGQKPEYRSIKERILKKIKADLSDELPENYHKVANQNKYFRNDARDLQGIRNASVDLVVTSPPFLNKVNYFEDNWMRAWFLGVEHTFNKTDLTVTPHLGEWNIFMKDVMSELGRVLKVGAHVVIEVGEVEMGRNLIQLEEELLQHLPLKVKGGQLLAREVLINSQDFTKLANCWDVKNNTKGTNTNRCLVVQKIK